MMSEPGLLSVIPNGKEVCFFLAHIASISTTGANFEMLKRINTAVKESTHVTYYITTETAGGSSDYPDTSCPVCRSSYSGKDVDPLVGHSHCFRNRSKQSSW